MSGSDTAKESTGELVIDPYKFLKIYNYIPSESGLIGDVRTPPFYVDFTTGLEIHLTRAREFDSRGRLVSARYYSDEGKTDLVVRIAYEYEFDAQGFPKAQIRTIIWISQDDTEHPDHKVERILYDDQLSKINLLERWRSNQIRTLKMRAIELLVYTTVSGQETRFQTQDAITIGQSFLAQHKMAFLNYVEDKHPEIYHVLETSTDFWLDNQIPHIGMSIREYLLEGLA